MNFTTIKKQTQSHKGLWNPRHGPGPGLAEDKTGSQSLPSRPSTTLKSPAQEEAPPAWASVTHSPSLLSSLLVYFFKLKQILPSALLICFHVKKKKQKQNVLNDLPIQ